MVFAPNFFGGQTVVQPVTNRLSKFDIYLHNEESHTIAIPTNEDLSLEDIYFTVSNQNQEEVFYKDNAALSIRTTSSITITVDDTLTNQHDKLYYAIRRTLDNFTYQKGNIIVDHASFHTA